MNSIKTIFTPDVPTSKTPIRIEKLPIENPAAVLTVDVSETARQLGKEFSAEVGANIVTDFEKTEALFRAGKVDVIDRMVHVSTFVFTGGNLYMTYYANTKAAAEDPNFQTARFVYCPVDEPENKTFLDVQSVGDECYDGTVVMVYDTIMMQKDENTLFILWTANISGKYYRLYRIFDIPTKTMGPVQVNRFRVGDIVNDFSTSGIQSALCENGIGCRQMYSDIGIMQKITTRVENGETYYYTGAYSGDFNCIIKSRDFVTWEYVSQPDFPNMSKWENAVYVIGDKCYYFVRQHDETQFGFLTCYNLASGTWETPVLIGDCQSRSDFILYEGQLYLFHAPIDREHLGIVRIDTDDIAKSEILLQAKMPSSCFYPFIQYSDKGELFLSYTVARQHIRLAKFTMSKYVGRN